MITDLLVKLLRRALCLLEGHEWTVYAGNRALCDKCPAELNGRKQLESHGLKYREPDPPGPMGKPIVFRVDPDCPEGAAYFFNGELVKHPFTGE